MARGFGQFIQAFSLSALPDVDQATRAAGRVLVVANDGNSFVFTDLLEFGVTQEALLLAIASAMTTHNADTNAHPGLELASTQITDLTSNVLPKVREVDSLEDLLSGSHKIGDVATRTDTTQTYLHNGGISGTLADWHPIVVSQAAPYPHVQAISTITGLADALAAKSSLGHGHDLSDVTGLVTALAAKAPTTHTHTTTDITGLATLLAGKAELSHTHTMSSVTGLTAALAGKADVTHTHTAASISGLTALLDAKADASRSVTAGTGLTGGGNLTADRSLAVSYGTTSGTACEGNDARVTRAATAVHSSGALVLPAISDVTAPSRSLYVSTTRGGKLCFKDAAGDITELS